MKTTPEQLRTAVDSIVEEHGGWRSENTRSTFMVRGAMLAGFYRIPADEIKAVFADLYKAVAQDYSNSND